MIDTEVVGRREFARLLGVTTRSLDRNRSSLPATLPRVAPPCPRGPRVLWSRSAVEEFIRSREGAK